MISVDIKADEAGVQYVISGHAMSAEPGKDIVCAGLSTLTDTLANMAERFRDEGLTDVCIVQQGDGFSHVFIKTYGNQAMAAALDAITIMYSQFADQYPDYVSLHLL